jgi:hypothetical protein
VAPPTYKDLRDFCRIDGWVDLKTKRSAVQGRKGQALDHDRYEKVLPDGRILRTKVSRGSGQYGDPNLWRRIWRDQLGLESEDQFWEALRTEKPVDRTPVQPQPPASAATKPAWLHRNLVLIAGIPEPEVLAMSADEAHARWTAFTNRERPGTG